MSFYFKYLFFEIKRMLRFLPKLLAGALALCLVIASIGIGCSKVLYEGDSLGKVNIAIVKPENDKYLGLMMGIIKEIKSVEKLCKFVEVDEATAYNMLERGEAFGAVVFPERFVQDIVHGKNTPPKVVIGKEDSLEGALFEELALSGTEMLGAVQAGVYTFIDKYEQATGEKIKNSDKIIKSINLEYVEFTLTRDEYFKHQNQTATNALSTMEYYIVMGAVLFILLFGMGLGGVIVNDNSGLKDRLRGAGVNDFVRYITNIIVVFIIYVILAMAGLLVANILGVEIELKATEFLFLLLGVLLGTNIVVGIYTVIESIVPASLTLFMLSVGMCFASGGFLPTAFLPEGVSKLSPYMPSTIMADMLGKIFEPKFSIEELILYAIMLLTINVIVLAFYWLPRLGGAEK